MGTGHPGPAASRARVRRRPLSPLACGSRTSLRTGAFSSRHSARPSPYRWCFPPAPRRTRRTFFCPRIDRPIATNSLSAPLCPRSGPAHCTAQARASVCRFPVAASQVTSHWVPPIGLICFHVLGSVPRLTCSLLLLGLWGRTLGLSLRPPEAPPSQAPRRQEQSGVSASVSTRSPSVWVPLHLQDSLLSLITSLSLTLQLPAVPHVDAVIALGPSGQSQIISLISTPLIGSAKSLLSCKGTHFTGLGD